VLVPAGIEVIGSRAFAGFRLIAEVAFESGTQLTEIRETAFAECSFLETFTVPPSVETIGDRCLQSCYYGVIEPEENRELRFCAF
jgi:hypothetical protein